MLQDRPFTLIGTLVWIICALFFMYEFLLRTIIGTFQHPIMYDLHITRFEFAVLSTTAYMLVYGFMQVPVGIIADRLGLKKTVLFGVSVCLISCIGFAFTHYFYMAIGFRLLMGFGSSFGFICLLVAVYDWMPNRYSALFIGLSQFIGTMGPMLAAGPVNSLASGESPISWHAVFISLGVFGIFLSLLIIFFVKSNQDKAGKFIILRKPGPISQDLKRIFSNSQVWIIAIYSSCIYFAIEYLSENEGKTFIMMNGYSSNFASFMITISWLGYAIGCPLLGFLSDFYVRRKGVMVGAAICGLLSVVTIFYFPFSRLILFSAFFLLGIGASGQSVGFAIMREQCKRGYLAAGLGFNNAAIAFLASLNAPLLGLLLAHFSQGEPISLSDYHWAFSLIVLLVLCSSVLAIFFIKETFCKSVGEPTLLSRN